MPAVDSRNNPPTASNSSVSDEETQLVLHLQRQLEEDVARIFDESIYTDIEVVCGKLKIHTNSCIIKARSVNFYHKLKELLHVSISRSTFDEIYSFISDTYTECNVTCQENEILRYLESFSCITNVQTKEELNDEFLTPKSETSFSDKPLRKAVTSSPSKELNKEYYALVPIDSSLLDKELIEQDVLSDAFQTIISTQTANLGKVSKTHHNKPTSLALASSHFSKSVKHSSSLLSLKDLNLLTTVEEYQKRINITSQNNSKNKNFMSSESGLESTYSPDSLIVDELSSASDYLSAVFTFLSPDEIYGPTQVNGNEKTSKMDNNFTSSDSGLENTRLLESLTSHKDVTVTDLSFAESTLLDITNDDESSHDSGSSSAGKIFSSTSKLDSDSNNEKSQKQIDTSCNSTKEEKQRQNEEIVILESSSLSSETGSWESVFPPKSKAKEIAVNSPFDGNLSTGDDSKGCEHTDISKNDALVQKSQFKSTSCFIDASSLVDEEEEIINIACCNSNGSEFPLCSAVKTPSQPLPCTRSKTDLSPNDWSENDNEDSLENKDPDSIQKDLSPTMFEMTPITEDSLCTFEQSQQKGQLTPPGEVKQPIGEPLSTVFVSNTPHNSIMTLDTSSIKEFEENAVKDIGRDISGLKNVQKYNESSPILSGGVSVEDHLPAVSTGSPLSRRRTENTPIVSGAYIPPKETPIIAKSPRPSCAPAWVVDMSSAIKTECEKSNIKRPQDKTCENLRNSSRQFCNNTENNSNVSISSVDSDSSERSSQKFYIDFSRLPDPIPQSEKEAENSLDKKNIFSIFIDFKDVPQHEKLPSKVYNSLGAKKNNSSDSKKPSNCNTSGENESSANSTNHFENFETLCDDPAFPISEIMRFNEKHVKAAAARSRKSMSNSTNQEQSKINEGENPERNTKSVIPEESVNGDVNALFVKLSDLDKPVSKSNFPKSGNPNKGSNERMTRSIPENNWRDQNQARASRSNDVISSFHSENASTLNRLFPHLKNEFSRSMPGSLSSRTRSPLRMEASSSPGDIDDQASDTSEMSSNRSSFYRSNVDNSSTEETSQASSFIGTCQSRLGQDLLRMFLEEIAPDVIVEVSGRRIKAHKCILSSRCQYFAGILSGGWVESAGNVISLPPFSYNVVHFALCHIYSGISNIPDTISIAELATLADMLCLEGLKEAIMFTLKARYCHHFHSPCPVCTAGVLECFPLSSLYGLDDLYRKCVKWIAKYFSMIWPTKAFAMLPSDLLEKCYQEVVMNLTLQNVIDTAYGCGITAESLPNSRWAEEVSRISRRLVNAAAHFIAPKLVAVLKDIGTLPPDPPDCAMEALNQCMTAAIEWAPPDECCRAYALLGGVMREIRNNRFVRPDLINYGSSYLLPEQDNLLYVHANRWILQCESALVKAASRVCCTQAFIDLPCDLRMRLRELGCILYGGPPPMPVQPAILQARRSRNINHGKSNRTQNSQFSTSLDIEHMRASFVPYAAKPTAQSNIETLPSSSQKNEIKKSEVIPPKVKTTKAQEERAKFNLSKATSSQERLHSKTVKTVFEATKSRYLEPKQTTHSLRKINNSKMISSSESSRNSSPIQVRNLRASRQKTRRAEEVKVQTLSQDSLATTSRPRTAEPSTDSLSESQNSNKYATYTKAKHTSKGTIEGTENQPAKVTEASTVIKQKIKTKIPVYLSPKPRQPSNSNIEENKPMKTSSSATTTSNTSISAQPKQKAFEKSASCSLMNATKSSSAKMVAKVVKESPRNKTPNKTSKPVKRSQRRDQNDTQEITAMERSGTFLKDEPTFVDQTTDIDLD